MATTSDPATAQALRAEVERIRPILEQYSEQSEVERALAHPVYDAMIDAGLFRTLVPRAFGGLELHPTEAYSLWEQVARIDSAAGWNLQLSAAVALFATPFLPKGGAEELYARGPDTVFAGGFFPPGPSVRVEGGWRVTSRNAFASGCHRAEWFLVPILEVDDESSKFDPHTEDPPAIGAFVPRDEVDIVDTWHTVGMRGTHSSDVSVDDVFVPDHRVAFLDRRPDRGTAFSGPVYGTVPWPGIHGETVVSLGIAAAAVDKLLDLAARKRPSTGRVELRDRELSQYQAARARALLEASRSFLYSAISDAFDESERGGGISEETKIRCQLAACFGAESSAKAVDLVHDAAGSTAIRLEHGFERHHRDVHVLTQHNNKSSARYVSVGRMLFGLPPDFYILKL